MNTNRFTWLSIPIVVTAISLSLLDPQSVEADHFDVLFDNATVDAYAPSVFGDKWVSYQEPFLSLRLATVAGKTTIQIREDQKVREAGIPEYALFFRSASGVIFPMAVGKGDELRTLNSDSVVSLHDVRFLADDVWAKIAGDIFKKGDPLQHGWDAAKPLELRK